MRQSFPIISVHAAVTWQTVGRNLAIHSPVQGRSDTVTLRRLRGGARVAFALVVLALAVVPIGFIAPIDNAGGAPFASPVELNAVVSTADGTERTSAQNVVATPLDANNPADFTVVTGSPRQYLRGVGAALTDSSAHLIAGLDASTRSHLLHKLFDPDKGGLSVVRIVIGSSDFSRQLTSLDDSTTPDPSLAKFSIAHDRTEIIPVLNEILAINPRVTIIAAPWSAPAWMKDTDNILYGQLEKRYESVYADYLVKFLAAYRAEGITVSRISVQNEPAAIQLTSPSMLMSLDQQIRVTQALGPKLAAAGLETRVLVWDHNWCSVVSPGSCGGPAPPQGALDVLQATAGQYPVAGTALHCYGGDQVDANEGLHAQWPNLEIWETECSGGTWQGTRTNAFADSAKRIIRDYGHWATASLLWNLALDPAGGPHTGGCGTCRGVVTVDPAAKTWTPEVDFDVLATVARFAPRGSSALTTSTGDAGPQDVEAVGVCSPTKRPSVIVWNPGAARNVSVRFGSVGFSVSIDGAALSAIQAPASVTCTGSSPLPQVGAPTTSVPDFPKSPYPAPPVQAATPIPTNPRYTG